MDLMTESVVLRFQGGPTGTFDRYGNAEYGPDRDETWRAWYEPRESDEGVDGGLQVSGYWLYLPLDAPLTASDAVLIAGLEYQVRGEPGKQPGGFLVEGFQKAAVRRVTG